VNGFHREGNDARRQTHLQGHPPPRFLVWLEPDEFPPVPLEGTVDGETYQRVFAAAAKLMQVDISAVEWQDPPEGSP